MAFCMGCNTGEENKLFLFDLKLMALLSFSPRDHRLQARAMSLTLKG